VTGADSSPDREHIAAALNAAAVLLVRHLGYGQSLTSNSVLARLDDGPARLTALAAASGVSQPSMTQLVGRLQREGLVVRLTDPEDGRATLVEISGAGRALLAQLRQSRHDRLTELLTMLSADDGATLSLAMRVALPLIEQLTHHAAERPVSKRDTVGLTT
jgi:DNA-binding MarR family transcriptional regulator